jgi:hypothetical protein
VIIGDFNGDTHHDILLGGMYGTLYPLSRIRDGSRDARLLAEGPAGNWMGKTAWACLDNSGRRDLISACWYGPPYQVWKTTATGFEEQHAGAKGPVGEHVSLDLRRDHDFGE